jgi:hypothetical protein
MISKSLRDPGNATTDTITLSVLILAELATTEEHALEMIQSKDSPFDAPFQSMQWIDVYSSLPPNPIHLEGLIKIIELKGGVENVRLPCLAAILSLQVQDLTLPWCGTNIGERVGSTLFIRLDGYPIRASHSSPYRGSLHRK